MRPMTDARRSWLRRWAALCLVLTIAVLVLPFALPDQFGWVPVGLAAGLFAGGTTSWQVSRWGQRKDTED